VGGDGVGSEGSSRRGFFDDEESAWCEVPGAVAVFVELLRRVLRRDPSIVGQDIGCCRGWGETDHGARAVVFPSRSPQRGHRGRLPRPCRADEDIDVRAETPIFAIARS
jgi:hypothetical protein